MEKWILVLDSGIGGSYTLKCLQKVLPNENFLFFMDKLHAPYGNKPAEKLKKIVVNSQLYCCKDRAKIINTTRKTFQRI